MSSMLWAVGAVVACGGMLYLAYRIEPHWVAKDGRRFLTTSEMVDRHGQPVGRRREVRGTVMGDGAVLLGKRSFGRTRTTVYRVRSKSVHLVRGRQQYVLEPVSADPMGDLVILRIPSTSRLAATFDELAARGSRSAEEA